MAGSRLQLFLVAICFVALLCSTSGQDSSTHHDGPKALSDFGYSLGTKKNRLKVSFTYDNQYWEYLLEKKKSLLSDSITIEFNNIDDADGPFPNETASGLLSASETFVDESNVVTLMVESGTLLGTFQVGNGSLIEVQHGSMVVDPETRRMLEVIDTVENPDDEYWAIEVNVTDDIDCLVETPPGWQDDVLPEPPGLNMVHGKSAVQHGRLLLDPYSFTPNCYRGDNGVKRELKVGLTTDKALFDLMGKRTDQMVAQLTNMVAQASQVYEAQLNLELRIEHIVINALGNSCPREINTILDAAVKHSDSRRARGQAYDAATWHHISGCSFSNNIAGIAYLGTLCRSGYNTGVTRFTRTAWRTFAHELGHSMGAQHSFENGMANTGGIMDYGDGTLLGPNGQSLGIHRFTSNRRSEICKVLQRVDEPSECPFFVKKGGQPTTKSPTNFPTKYPTRDPTNFPTRYPTRDPTNFPTRYPTQPATKATKSPTRNPTRFPTRRTTQAPTSFPTRFPTKFPTQTPKTPEPTPFPTAAAPSATKGPTPGASQDPSIESLMPGARLEPLWGESSRVDKRISGIVRYGASGRYVYAAVANGRPFSCSNNFFFTDPYPGKSKSCFIVPIPSLRHRNFFQYATYETRSFTTAKGAMVRFGVRGDYVYRLFEANTKVDCNTKTFFNTGIRSDRRKYCYVHYF